jgi:O-antigen/teichoic acid export membrane protein
MISKVKNYLGEHASLHELLSSGAISFFMQCAGMLSGYVLMALIANYFGATILGIYSFSYTALMLAVILSSLGLDMVILKIAARSEINSAKATLIKIYSIVIPSAIVFTAAAIIISFQYFNLFFDAMEYRRYLILTATSLIFSVILAVNIEYLRANGCISVSEFMRNVLRPLISIFLIITTCVFYYDVYIPVYALWVSSFLACLVSVYFVFWRHNINNRAYESGCDETLTTLLASGLPMQLSMLAFYMISNMVIFFIEHYESSVSVGFMLVAIKLAGLINMPLMVLNKVCAPKFSRFYSEKKYKELQEYLFQVTKLAFYVAVVMSVFLVVYSDHILSIFGGDFVQAKNILLILVFGQLVSCASGSVGLFMMMTGNEKVFRNIAAIVALASFGLYFMVVPIYGVIGAAYVLACSQAALNIVSVIYIKYRLGFITMYIPFKTDYLK